MCQSAWLRLKCQWGISGWSGSDWAHELGILSNGAVGDVGRDHQCMASVGVGITNKDAQCP